MPNKSVVVHYINSVPYYGNTVYWGSVRVIDIDLEYLTLTFSRGATRFPIEQIRKIEVQ